MISAGWSFLRDNHIWWQHIPMSTEIMARKRYRQRSHSVLSLNRSAQSLKMGSLHSAWFANLPAKRDQPWHFMSSLNYNMTDWVFTIKGDRIYSAPLNFCSISILPLDSLRKHAKNVAYIYTFQHISTSWSHTLCETVLTHSLCTHLSLIFIVGCKVMNTQIVCLSIKLFLAFEI